MRKKALIIGGSSGIGLATVDKLIAHDYEIVLVHRDRRQQVALLNDHIAALKAEKQILCFNLDATNSEKIAACLHEIQEKDASSFHLVLHALSRGNLKPFVGDQSRLNAEDLKLTIAAMGTNLHQWVTSLLDQKLLTRDSRIIALTSEGNDRVWKGYGAVGLAKATLETLCKYLAAELAPEGIRVNVIQAGVTDTPSLRMIPEVEELIDTSKNRNPSGRLTLPQDVANMIYLLTLPEAAWVTGSLIHVDGGEHLI
ncbi:MAG: enoyl-[acyl-carrier protein] reductase III [Cyclobacteriaceae bacterium]|jgi:enoyl-[acyl-carrier protein] reductase III